jgi:hypothetical protein
MGTDDPGTAGLAEEKQKSHKPACRVFVSACPIRAANAPVPSSIGVNQCNLGLNKMLLVTL